MHRRPAPAPSPDLPAERAETGRVAEALGRLVGPIETYLKDTEGPFLAAGPGDGPPWLGPLPERGGGLDAVLADLSAAIPAGSIVSKPGFSGFITTGATTSGAAAQVAMAFAGGQRYGHHAFNALETLSLRWLADLCGLPSEMTGVSASGGSTANLLALGAARQAALERLGVDAAEDGVPVTFRGRIYASSGAHRTIHRSAAVLGMGRRGVAEVPVDADGRIRLDELEAVMARDAAAGVHPVAVVAIAGVTDTGSVDDIDGIVRVARRHGAWVHVDGAYGLIGNAAPSLRHLYRGIERADSWIVDPHKWLATGVGVAATFVRDGDVLRRAFAEGHAAYLEGSAVGQTPSIGLGPDGAGGERLGQLEDVDFAWADSSVELSSPPRGVMAWAVMRELGREGVIARVERHVGFARHLAARVEADPRLELLIRPQLSVVCFRHRHPDPAVEADPSRADDLTSAIHRRLQRETRLVPSTTVVNGRLAIRPCYINPRTTLAEVDGLADEVLRLGAELVAAR